MKLEQASMLIPKSLPELLADLGNGESGFSGTPVHTGEVTLEQFLRICCDMPDPAKLKPGLVPQTVYWMIDSDGDAIGMVRVRHYLNGKLLIHGGHIGYYVRRDKRGNGLAKEALRLALMELKKLGENRALLTVDDDNIPSIKVIETNGGKLEDIRNDPDTGKPFRRYWIDLNDRTDIPN